MVFLTLDRMCRVEIWLLYKITYFTTISTPSLCWSVEFVVCIGDLLNAPKPAWNSDWKLFWNWPHNLLNAWEVDWLIDRKICWKHWRICWRELQSNSIEMFTHKTRMNHPREGTRISSRKSQAKAPKILHTCLSIGR